MKIIDKVKIGYKDYKVTKVDGNLVRDNIVCYGNIEYDNSNINISNLYSKDQQECAFIHECLHGIDDIVEAKLTEDQVRLMGKGLYDFIKSNPEIFKDDSDERVTIIKKIGSDEIVRTVEG